MDTSSTSGVPAGEGATVVITHKVRVDKQADYERWLQQIAPVCRAYPGGLDWHIIRPIAGLSENYTVIIRFDTEPHLRAWMESPVRAQYIEKVKPLLVTGDDFYISSGLDFWFTPEEAKAKIPHRWKQAFITWTAIFPLVLGVPLIILPLLRSVGVPTNHYLDTAFVTASVVALMVYVVMPPYTKLIHRWLFR
jgi:antibiotic biosynthesis monooxygenase (ABM) superfamily enzyme